MARNVARVSDQNSGGGTVTTTPQGSVFVNGLLVAVNGSTGTGHPSGGKHQSGAWQTANASGTVFINGLPVNAAGDADSCGHVRVGGSPDTFIG